MDHPTGQTRIVKALVALQDTVRAKDQLVHTFERQIVQLTADSSSWRNRYAVLKHAYVITKQRHDALLKTTEVLEQANLTLERDNTALKQDAATQQDYCVATLQKEDALEILRKSHTRLQSERAALQQQLAQKERDLGSANASLQKEYDAVKQNLETRDRELQRLYSALAERNRERTLEREPIQVPTLFYAHCDISQRGPQWEKHASRRLEGESAQMNEGMQGGRSGSDDWQPNSFLETILNTGMSAVFLAFPQSFVSLRCQSPSKNMTNRCRASRLSQNLHTLKSRSPS